MRKSIRTITSEYTEALDWIKSKVKINKKCRLDDLLEELKKLSSFIDPDTNKLTRTLDGKPLSFYTSEAAIIIEIVTMLKEIDTSIFPRSVLKKMVQGSVNGWEETHLDNSKTPRDHQFELELGTILRRAGCKIIGFEDIISTVGNYRYSFQCKRLSKPENFYSNLKKAENQLLSNNILGGLNFGIIVVSLDFVMETNKKWFKDKSKNEVLREIDQRIDLFESEIQKYFDNSLNIKILGIFCVVKNNRFDGEIGNLEPAHRFTMYKNPIVDLYALSNNSWNEINKRIMKLKDT